MGQDIPAIQAISDSDLRGMIDGAEHAHQLGYRMEADGYYHPAPNSGITGYPNMKIEAIFDCNIKEYNPHRDLTGYSRLIFGEGKETITANVNSGKLVLNVPPGARIVVIPMNSGQVMIEARPL